MYNYYIKYFFSLKELGILARPELKKCIKTEIATTITLFYYMT